MDVVLKNLHKFDSNFYRGIEINEFPHQNKYLVKFFGRDVWFDSVMVADKRSLSLLELSSEEKIREVINDYLSSTKIDKFTGLISKLSRYQNMCFEANGTRYLFFNIQNLGLRTVIDEVFSKYVQDRFDFCYGNMDIKDFRVDFSSYQTCYGITDDKMCRGDLETSKIMYLTLKLDDNYDILSFEQKFISEFMIDMFSKFNEEIKITQAYDYESDYRGCLFQCGDIRIYFKCYKKYILWIFDIVDKYNRELREVNENIKKRQLKMEGF